MSQSEIDRLRAGNTKLIEALMDMVNQFFRRPKTADPVGGEWLCHRFTSAEEGAISILIEAEMAEEVEGKGYRLLWDKLDELKKLEIEKQVTGGEK